MKTTAGSLLLALLICSGVSVAQARKEEQPADLKEVSLEDLMKIKIETVSGASKHEQKVTEAPASVSVVTAADIQHYGYRTLAEILQSVRGFYATYDRNYSYLGVRGFARPGDYNTRVLLLIDGHRQNDDIFDTAWIGTEFPIDLDLIERIEFIRGPVSSLYGANAFFGVINVVTKKGQDLKGLEVSVEGGSLATSKERFSFGHTTQKGIEVLFSGTFYNSHGQNRLYFPEYDQPSTHNGIAENVDQDRAGQLFMNVSFREFTVQGVFSSREKHIPTGSFDTVFNDPRTHTNDARGYLDLRYQHNFSSQWEMTGRLFYDWYAYDGDYVYGQTGEGSPQDTINKDLARGQWWGAELKLSRTLARKHKLSFGSEYRLNFQQDQKNYDLVPYQAYLDDRRQSGIGAVFFQDEYSLCHNLILNVGVRYDHYGTFGGTANPRLGLIFTPRPKTAIKLLYGEAFRAPNSYELYYSDGVTLKPNPFLTPETIRTNELVLEQYLGNYFRLSASGFDNRMKNLISQQEDPLDGMNVFNNIENIKARGLEFEIEGKSAKHLQGQLSYTFQQSRVLQTGAGLTNSPKHLAKLNLEEPFLKGNWFAGMNLLYMSRRQTLSGSSTSGYTVVNLTVSTPRLFDKFEFSAGLYNMFNRKYFDPVAGEFQQDAISQDGRSFRLKLTHRF